MVYITVGLLLVVFFFCLINSDWWQNVQIDSDFKEHIEEKKRAHSAKADRRFSTRKLAAELADINRRVNRESDELYGGPLKADKETKAQLSDEFEDVASKLKYFTKNYKKELDKLYASKAAKIEEVIALKNIARETQ